jgi:hypothetical protein
MIKSNYLKLCRTPSDINEHLPILAKYASECNHVTECGVRTAVSSYAFASALVNKPGTKLIQVDTQSHPNIVEFQRIAGVEGLETIFYAQSDLECPLEHTDLLFIDTWHIYGHLKRELARWHTYADKYIILHDTTVDEWYGESVRCGWDADKQSRESGIPVSEIKKGLWPAIEEFLLTHQEWKLELRLFNNNGLTVLTRK